MAPVRIPESVCSGWKTDSFLCLVDLQQQVPLLSLFDFTLKAGIPRTAVMKWSAGKEASAQKTLTKFLNLTPACINFLL